MSERKRRAAGAGSLPARQRPDGRWETRLTLPDGRRRSFYGATWEEAEKKLNTARAELEAGTLAEPGRVTVATLGTEFFRLNPDGLRASTLRTRRSNWDRWVLPAIGHVRLRDLRVQHVLGITAAARDAGRASSTITSILVTMQLIFEYGRSANLLSVNPAAEIKRESHPDPRELPIQSAAQIATLLDAVRASRYRTALLLGLGLRIGEVLGLRWPDVDFEQRLIRVRSSVAQEGRSYVLSQLKTRSSRRDLPMPDFIYEELRAARRRQTERRLQLGPAWTNLDLVVTHSGGLLSQSAINKETWRLREITGIEGLVFHHLRHLCATVMMLNNVPPRIAQGVLGHSTTATTMQIYQHVTPDALRDAADALQGAFAAGLRDTESG